MKPVDETTMLRFASGEMSHAEEATFLCRCEMEPALWREAVLTVVEHRRLVSALSEFAVEEQPSPPVRTSPKSAKRPARAAAWRVAAVSAAMAAGFLLALLGIHWFTPTTHAGSVLPSPTMAVAEAASAPQAVPDGRPPRGPTAVAANREPANALANGSELAGDAALHDAVGALGMEPIIPAAQMAALRSQGFQVEEQPTVYIIDAGNGRRWAVPTQRATLHYVKR